MSGALALSASSCGNSVAGGGEPGKVVELAPDRSQMLEAMQARDCSVIGPADRVDAWHAAKFVPWFGKLRVGASTIDAVAPELLAFRLEGDGQMSERRLAPITPAARSLLAGPTGPRIERITHGAFTGLDGLEDVATARGITFTRTREELTTARLAHFLELADIHDGPFWVYLFGSNSPKQVRQEWTAVVSQVEASNPVAQNAGWLVLGPAISNAALDPRATDAEETVLLWVLQHEVQHGASPAEPERLTKAAARPTCPSQEASTATALRESLAPVNWLEEASTDTVAQLPGGRERTAKATGLHLLPAGTVRAKLPDDLAEVLIDPSKALRAEPGSLVPSFRTALQRMVHEPQRYPFADLLELFALVAKEGEAYPDHNAALGQLLGLAGLDAQDPGDRTAVIELLQGHPSHELPEVLAARIAKRKHLDAKAQKELATRIANIGVDALTQPPGTLERRARGVVKWVESA